MDNENNEDEEISQTIIAKQIVRALSISYENLEKNIKKVIENKDKNPDELQKAYNDAQYDVGVIHTLTMSLKPSEKNNR